VREVGFQFFSAPGIFVCHAMILPASSPEVEAVMVENVARGPRSKRRENFPFFAAFAAFARHFACQIKPSNFGE
jgi:hypothetical protein